MCCVCVCLFLCLFVCLFACLLKTVIVMLKSPLNLNVTNGIWWIARLVVSVFCLALSRVNYTFSTFSDTVCQVRTEASEGVVTGRIDRVVTNVVCQVRKEASEGVWSQVGLISL